MHRRLRAGVLKLVAKGIDHLLLPQLACKVVALRAIDIAVARIRQGPLAIEMQPALGEAVIEEEIEKRPLVVDVDAADGVDDLLERGEVDAHERMHGLIEDPRDGVRQKTRPATGITALAADEVRVIEPVHAERADVRSEEHTS